MLKHSPAMEDLKLPLLAKPPRSSPSLIYIRLMLISLLIHLLFLPIIFFELFLLIPTYVEPLLAGPPVAKITDLHSLSFNSSRNPNGTWSSTDRKVYRLLPTLSLPNPEGKSFAPDAVEGFIRGCLYRNNTCVSRALPRVSSWGRETMCISLKFEMDEAGLGGVEESGRVLAFDLWMGAAYVVSEPGSWFEKIRVTKVACRDVEAAYPAGVGDGNRCEAKTWPILNCRWCYTYRSWLLMVRNWLLMFGKGRKAGDCPEEPSLISPSSFDG